MTRPTVWAVVVSAALVLGSGLAAAATVFHLPVLGVAHLGPAI